MLWRYGASGHDRTAGLNRDAASGTRGEHVLGTLGALTTMPAPLVGRSER
jgi:hypothetical protein